VRSLLGRLGARGGAAVGLIIVVLAVVAIARLVDDGPATPPFNPGAQPSITVDPTEGDDGEVAPTPTAYADDAELGAAALTFMSAWLRRELDPPSWHQGIAELATGGLATSLEGVDPVGVPALRMTGSPTIVLRTELFAQVGVPVDTGTVQLTMVKQGGEWLVDGVDWIRT
jgi:hypothetical protein